MRFTLSAVLALASIAENSDAFLSPTLRMKTTSTAIHMDENFMDSSFMDALAPKGDDDDEVNEDGPTSSRFREMMDAAKQEAAEPTPRAITNPYLDPPPSTLPPPTQPAAIDPGALSVEDQARMFRELMAGRQLEAPVTPAPVERASKTDEAGRPLGRNTDADKITNTSDLYFAQLKRDSTVRTIARIQDDGAVSEKVFGDEGIEKLGDLLAVNPYLQGQQDEERALLDNLPDEIVAPYFQNNEVRPEEMGNTGVSYKQILLERRQRNKGGGSVPAPTPAPIEEPKVEQSAPPPPPPPKPEPVVAQVSTPPPTPPEPEPQQAAPVPEPTPSFTATSSTDGRKQNIRTLMGLTLKHRGGPGFGKGRLKGPDIDLFEGLVGEITTMFRDEANLAPPAIGTPVVATVEAISTPVADPVPVQAAAVAASADAEPANIDSTIACIEGAIAMYNNSPPAIRESVLGVLRAALMSAVDTCNVALAAQPAPPVAASADASIEGMVACIEGAVTMYKNCPPALKDSVLATLRLALMSAVGTCDAILSPGQVATPVAAVAPAPVAPVSVASQAPPPSNEVPPPPSNTGTDRNSKALEKLFENVQAASGDGKLGLRSDLTAAEATELADQLVDMRGILMEELESDIPDPEPAEESPQGQTGSSIRYEQMLAKARKEKEKSS